MSRSSQRRFLVALGPENIDDLKALADAGCAIETACSLEEASEMLASGVCSGALTDAGTLAALIESEGMHRDLIERSNDGIIVLQDSLIKFVNPRFAEMSGYSAEKLLNTPFTDYLTRAEAAVLAKRYKLRIAGGCVPSIYEISLTRHDGQKTPLELSAAIVTFQGRPADLVLVRDITDRKQAEEYLLRYRLLFQNARDIILLLGPDCAILEANRAAVEAYGYSHDELLSMSARELRTEEEQDSLKVNVRRAKRGPIRYETIHRRKDQSRFPIEVSLSSTVIRDKPVLLAIIRDITERKRAEEVLDAERRRLRSVLDALPVAVMIADADGGYAETNEQANIIWGGPVPHVRSKDEYGEFTGWWADSGEAIRPEDWAMARAITKGETVVGEMVNILRFDGRSATILNSAAPVKDADGRIIGGIVAEQDITELVRLRLALEHSLNETEHESWRTSVLEGIAEAGLSITGLPELLDTVVRRVANVFNVDECCVFVLDEKAEEFEARAAHNLPEMIGCRVRMNEGLIGRVASERRTIYVADVRTDLPKSDSCDQRSPAVSMLGVPLIARDHVVGVVRVQSFTHREFAAEEVRLLQAIADRVAMAIDNAKLYDALQRSRTDLEEALEREKHFSLLLQHALLPANPSVGEGYDVAVRYVPAFVGREVGGDFYDVFEAGHDRAAILIGDVLGKGLEAASLAATTRSTIHAFIYGTQSAQNALNRTNRVLDSQKPTLESFVTVCLVTLELSTGEIRYCSAGHPPAVVCRADGTVEFLPQANLPLGVVDDLNCTQAEAQLHPGDKLVLYTDGISEAHAGVELFDTEGIERVLTGHSDWTPEKVVASLIDAATQWADGRLKDDAVVVVVSRTP